MKAWFLALAISLGSTVALADQFDLACSGTVTTLAPGVLLNESKPYTSIYRLDLDAKKWCEDACKVQRDLVEVTAVSITLQDKKVDTPREHEVLTNRISRETGQHSAMADSGIGRSKVAIFWKGQCEKRPFSGFPKVETKF